MQVQDKVQFAIDVLYHFNNLRKEGVLSSRETRRSSLLALEAHFECTRNSAVQLYQKALICFRDQEALQVVGLGRIHCAGPRVGSKAVFTVMRKSNEEVIGEELRPEEAEKLIVSMSFENRAKHVRARVY